MNLRLFLLIAMTVFFAVLWSSDRQYQEAQIAVARAARRPAEDGRASATSSARASRASRAAAAAPSNGFIWFARMECKRSNVDLRGREPRDAKQAGPNVAFIVSFGRPAIRFQVCRLDEPTVPLDIASGVPSGRNVASERGPEYQKRILSRCISYVISEIDGQTCALRWKLRRWSNSARHRLRVLVFDRLDWLAIAEKVSRGLTLQFDTPGNDTAGKGMVARNAGAKNAAAPASAEKR